MKLYRDCTSQEEIDLEYNMRLTVPDTERWMEMYGQESTEARRELECELDVRFGSTVLVTLGPLTNVAHALVQNPSIASEVKECVVMGGIGKGHGNVTPVAEYNIWADPEAAKIVFESGLSIKMVGWDVSYTHATFDPQEADRLRGIGTPVAEFCVDIQRVVNKFSVQKTTLDGFDLPDPIAMAVALDRAVATRTEPLFVAIETDSELCRGQTVVDHLPITEQEPNVAVVLEASRDRFLHILYDAVR